MNAQSNDIRTRFGLNALPFTREFAVDSRWCHPSFDEPLQELQRTVEQRMSAAIIGPAGSGKTVLLRALRDRLPEPRYRVTYVKVTQLGKRDFCREIARAIGCQPAGQYNVLVRRIQEHVSHTSASEGVRPLLLVDEAHDMAPETLAILRILTNRTGSPVSHGLGAGALGHSGRPTAAGAFPRAPGDGCGGRSVVSCGSAQEPA